MAASASGVSQVSQAIACVFQAPRSDRLLHDLDLGRVLVVCVGPPFLYTIPSFDVLAVEMRQIKVKTYSSEDEEKHYDMFIRNLPSFTRLFPAWMAVRAATVVNVSLATGR